MNVQNTFLLGVLLLSACTSVPVENIEIDEELEVGGTPTMDTTQPGPWDGALFLTRSGDGLDFDEKTLVLEEAGVPNLLLLENDDLVLMYQYFSSTNPALFNVMAYSISQDDGETWTDPQALELSNLPEPIDSGKVPMDPTLVQLEDGRLRVYFTYHAEGSALAELYSATAAGDDVSASFVVETTPALSVPKTFLLDPAVVFFDGLWHHYTWDGASDNNFHSTSEDGVSFDLEEGIELPMDFLGQVIAYDKGLRFYGTGEGGVVSAYSEDGYTWELDQTNVMQGADPGVQQLADGSFVMVYTSMNFNEVK